MLFTELPNRADASAATPLPLLPPPPPPSRFPCKLLWLVGGRWLLLLMLLSLVLVLGREREWDLL